MKRLTILLASTLWLTGCCPPPLLVPVSNCPQPPEITMPLLAVDQLPAKPDTAAALKAFGLDHITLRETLRQCIIIREGYRQ